MNSKSWLAAICAVLVTLTVGCGADRESDAGTEPFKITLTTAQVGDVPAADNEVETAIEKYTNTQLEIQWIPNAAYDDKINVMLAANEMPMMLRVKYVPMTISAIQSDLFWEVGPLLKDYKNLSAQSRKYYDNIAVDGKIYGIPLFRDMARSAIIYRKDWLDSLGLQPPTTLEEWYIVLKAMALNDPDGNGKKDTYGMVLDKKYNDGSAASTTRLAVSMGAPNKWGVDANGRFTPEFVSPQYVDVLKLLRRLYEEKLINDDFAVLDESEAEKLYDSGRVGMRIAVAQNAKSMQDRLIKSVPTGRFDVMPPTGPQGPRAAGELGNNGFFVFSKSAVRSEAELRRILAFIDSMLDEPMSTLQMRGLEGKHYASLGDGTLEIQNFNLFQREVKPYRDSLFNIEGYHVAPLKDTPLGEKGRQIPKDNLTNMVSNPALTLTSQTNTERGKELEQMIADAQTRYIMGIIDDAGWEAEVDKWRMAGGDRMSKEYEEAYKSMTKRGE
ncbi:extracellular solute-binding protein [Paenibacillus sp. GD4]|uniref:extracellular solute-binding protein n=1 Tax=Paenibacillus sp. GD4 TaxID=3068890 RepID=UPI002796765D|nr:extracellular solute-binding protein [Paenibacillus sp. GD4]MDQ1909943.1 extracellular solute-binding protein [Paenibacillus sp. GD4]